MRGADAAATLLAAALALAPAAALAEAGPLRRPGAAIPRVDLDGLFTFGVGNGSSLGGQVHADLSWGVWRTARALGTLELGVQAGYVNEPLALQPWADANTSGTTHRVPFAVTAGHGFRFGRDDRVSLGVHLYAGAVHWISSYDVRFPSRGVEGNGTLVRTVPDLGAFLRFTYRPHPVVGLALQLGAPFYGISPETVVGLFSVGAGMTFRLR